MRHYNIRNIRVDGCSALISITSGTSEDAKKLANNINNIQVTGNDVLSLDAIILTEDTECRIKNSVFSDNVFASSFSYVPFRFSSVESTVINGNTIMPNSNLSVFELESEKHNQKYSMSTFMTAKNIRNLNVSNNTVIGVGVTVVGVRADGVVDGLVVSNNSFSEFGTADYTGTRRLLYVETSTLVNRVSFIGNTLQGQPPAGKNYDITNADRSKVIVDGNTANITFRDAYKYVDLAEEGADNPSFSFLSGNLRVRCWYNKGMDGYISGELQILKNTSYSSSVDANGLIMPTPSPVKVDKPNVSGVFSGLSNIINNPSDMSVQLAISNRDGGRFEILDSKTDVFITLGQFVENFGKGVLKMSFRYPAFD